jgi:hypothetical protein
VGEEFRETVDGAPEMFVVADEEDRWWSGSTEGTSEVVGIVAGLTTAGERREH